VIKLTGGTPLTLGSNGSINMAQVYTTITGIVPPPNDGIVSVDSALSGNVSGTQPPATLGQRDTINALTAAQQFGPADHRTILGTALAQGGADFQALTEAFVAPKLSFEFNNSADGTSIYPDSGAASIMKGVGTRSHFYPFGVCFATKWFVSSLTSSQYLNYTPTDPIPVTNCGTTTPITFTVTSNPPGPIAISSSGQAIPTASTVLEASDDQGDYYQANADFFVLPQCTSCITSGAAPLNLRRKPAGAGQRARSINPRGLSTDRIKQ
jgi:hypothetical protein